MVGTASTPTASPPDVYTDSSSPHPQMHPAAYASNRGSFDNPPWLPHCHRSAASSHHYRDSSPHTPPPAGPTPPDSFSPPGGNLPGTRHTLTQKQHWHLSSHKYAGYPICRE